MIRCVQILLVMIFCLLLTSPSYGVDPDIRLQDPALEARAKHITQRLRCPTCVSQSVDSSNVGISRDLQVLVRERVLAGDSDQQILNYVASRYGDFVLLNPRMNAQNALLWLLPFTLFGVALTVLLVQASRQQKHLPAEEKTLTATEHAALAALMAQDERANTQIDPDGEK